MWLGVSENVLVGVWAILTPSHGWYLPFPSQLDPSFAVFRQTWRLRKLGSGRALDNRKGEGEAFAGFRGLQPTSAARGGGRAMEGKKKKRAINPG